MIDKSVATSSGRAQLISFDEAKALELWRRGFDAGVKDHRYFELVAETLSDDFDPYCAVLEDDTGQVRGVQPVFFVHQDLITTGPAWIRYIAKRIRTFWPRFLKLRMLMVGCAAGAGTLPRLGEPDQRWSITALAEALPRFARLGGASLIIWKDYPVSDRASLEPITTASGFTRISSMPATRLKLKFSSFDDYLQGHLSHATRKNLRRKFKATRSVPLTFEVRNSLAAVVDEAYPLYQQVLARSPLQFERLTKEFLVELGKRLPDQVRFFLWRNENRLVAFSVCLLHDGAIYDEYLGLDYSVALDWHLYFVTLRDVLTWGIENGMHTYFSTPLNYDPKLHLGFELVPLDLYVTATFPLLRPLIRLALPWIEPTRAEPALRHFPNSYELFSL